MAESLTTVDIDTFKEASDALLDAWRKMDDVLDLCTEKAGEELSPSGPWHKRVPLARNIKTDLRAMNEGLKQMTQ